MHGCVLLLGCFFTLVQSQIIQYRVKITSNDDLNPGDEVEISLYGDNVQSPLEKLENIHEGLQGKNEAVFPISAQEIGSIKQIKIKRIVNGPKNNWFLKKITVYDVQGKKYEFLCKCVLSRESGIKVITPSNVIGPTVRTVPTFPTNGSPVPSLGPSTTGNMNKQRAGERSTPSKSPTSHVTSSQSSGSSPSTSPTMITTSSSGTSKQTTGSATWGSPTSGSSSSVNTSPTDPTSRATSTKTTGRFTATTQKISKGTSTKNPESSKSSPPTVTSPSQGISSQSPGSSPSTSPTIASPTSRATSGETSATTPTASNSPSEKASTPGQTASNQLTSGSTHKPKPSQKSTGKPIKIQVKTTSISSSTSPGSTTSGLSETTFSQPTKGSEGTPSTVVPGTGPGSTSPTKGSKPRLTGQPVTEGPTSTDNMPTTAAGSSTPSSGSPPPTNAAPTTTVTGGSTGMPGAQPTKSSPTTPSLGKLLGLTPQQMKAANLEALPPDVAKEAAKVIAQMNKMLEKREYRVRIISQDDFNPNDAISIQFHGKNGSKTDFKPLIGIYKKFDGANEAVFNVTAKDVGEIGKISLKRVVNGLKNDWYVEKVEVMDLHSKIYEFLCKCTLAANTGVLVTNSPSNVVDFNKTAGKVPSNIPTVGTEGTTPPPPSPVNDKAPRERSNNKPIVDVLRRNRIFAR